MAFGAFGKIVKSEPLVLQYVHILGRFFQGASFSTCKMYHTCKLVGVVCIWHDDVGLGKAKQMRSSASFFQTSFLRPICSLLQIMDNIIVHGISHYILHR